MKRKIACAVLAGLAVLLGAGAKPAAEQIVSEGRDWPSHLQGVCTDGTNIWWSHTTVLAKTDLTGKLLVKSEKVKSHHGDLCVVGGRLYVAVNHGVFNREKGAKSWVYAYDAATLKFLERWPVDEVTFGAGGMTYKDGKFYVIGGLPGTYDENYAYEYTSAFKFVKRHTIASGWTNLGIQSCDYAGGKFRFGCYGGKKKTADGTEVKVPSLTLVCDANLQLEQKVEENTSEGVLMLKDRVWKAGINCWNRSSVTNRSDWRFTVKLVPAKKL